jgi:hypothetical protein
MRSKDYKARMSCPMLNIKVGIVFDKQRIAGVSKMLSIKSSELTIEPGAKKRVSIVFRI